MAVESNLKDMSLTRLGPVTCLEQHKSAPFLEHQGEEGAAMSGERILIIDDEPFIVHLCTKALTAQGYNARGVSNGQDALSLLEREPFDLLLIDLRMPDMDGLEILQRAKSLYPHVGAIIITGHGTLETAVESLRLGALDFVDKPFTPQFLTAKVRQALERVQQPKTVVRGNLRSMSLTSIVSINCNERNRARLRIRHGVHQAQIFFDAGNIVHATLDGRQGGEVIYEMLQWEEGVFENELDVPPPTRTVNHDWSWLLLEGLRRIDEATLREEADIDLAGEPGPAEEEKKVRDAAQAQVPSPAEIKQDSIMENDLIFLLSRLEHSRAQLADKKNQKQPTLALQILTEMVNDILDFAEKWLDAETTANSLAKALAEAGEMYPAARLSWIQHNPLSVQKVSRLYSDWASSGRYRRRTFHQIGQSMVYILETYFSLCTARFRSPSIADRWRETFSIFVPELAQVVDKIRF